MTHFNWFGSKVTASDCSTTSVSVLVMVALLGRSPSATLPFWIVVVLILLVAIA